MSERIIALIPFHKNKEQLERCLKHLGESSVSCASLVFDDSEIEGGFTASVNRLFKLGGDREYFLVLNQDCYLDKEAVSELVKFMDDHPKCAQAGVKQTMEDKETITHGGTGDCFPAGQHEGGLVSKGDCRFNKQVGWVNGACFIVRKSALEEVGRLDPNFKMFGSDSDFSYRCRLFGWECWYVAKAVCVHEQSASRLPSKVMQQTLEADMRYFRDKWLLDETYRDLSLEVFE